MYTALALDAGDILEQEAVDIGEDMTAGELYETLSVLGADVLRRTLEKMKAGTLMRTPQKEEEATYFPMFKKGFGQIDFSKTGRELHDFVRGTNPAPGAYMMYRNEKIRVYRVSAHDYSGSEPCGTVLYADDKRGLGIRCADGLVTIDELKRSGAPVSYTHLQWQSNLSILDLEILHRRTVWLQSSARNLHPLSALFQRRALPGG